MQALQGRWVTDARKAVPGADGQLLADVGRDLLARWGEPHRGYHGTSHLAEVLAAVDTLCRAGKVGRRDRSVAVLGAWFHDAVYDIGDVEGGGNERRSAALASRTLAELGADPDLVDDVVTAVLDTADHDLGGGGSPSREVLHDADLWVLAAPTPRFDEYCREVRREYAAVPAAAYSAARAAVLRPFLLRDHVYRTEHARRAWEPTARENLARELTRLAA
ncbi:hypothetical protein [uncultured Phycicoccus sp.]|uniref:HD domain-containing protein n=1 Tax=uncultured Phycicoccus sp. TaxID=661422 RepID=UPI002621CB36|nr:hypothetical protein [uncultured Phycicoccus sp.]